MIRKILRFILKHLKKPDRIPGKERFITNLNPSPIDVRDDIYAVKTTSAIPSNIDFSTDCPPVKRQGSIGSCGSHAFCTAMETLVTAQRGRDKTVPLSELFHYYVVRSAEFENTLPADNGQYLRDGAKVCLKIGVSPEKLCPYNTRNYNNKPSSFSYSFAKFFKIKSYNRCWSVDSILQQLSTKNPVVFGIQVYSDMVTNKTGEVTGNGNYLGGHAVCAVGYDNNHKNSNGTLGAVRFVNSWGSTWGDNGYGWISYNILRRDMLEAWSIAIQ